MPVEEITGAIGTLVTVRVKPWPRLPATFAAPIVKLYSPTAIVPAIVISPVELLIDTPVGWPLKEYVIGAVPVVVTWKVPPVPLTTAAVLAEVMDGTTKGAVTVRVKPCRASGSVPFAAPIVKLYSPTAIVPAIVISPVELLIDTPVGCPLKEYVIGIVPVAVTWKVPPVPLTTAAVLAEVMDGATKGAVTVRAKLCMASGSVPFTAVIVK
ncbi:hypothetical protein AGMMS50293_04250 [Spirochaetia bacterium]|nr:hypothetical protein AGMMS50293_04250 [Spirochaetia bacterium]